MKKIIVLLAVVMAIPVFFNSCTKEKTDDREAFVGSWQVAETWTNSIGSGTDNYTIQIAKSTTSDNGVVITNFGGVGYTAQGTVSGTSLTIPVQISSGDSFSGSGSLSGSTLIMNYSVVDGWSASCTATKL
jgi:hypothetical protein